MLSSVEDEDNFMFEIYTEKIKSTKFNNAKRMLISYVGTRYPDVKMIFSHDVDKVYEYPEVPVIVRGEDPHNFIKDKYKKGVEIVMRNEDEYKRNKKLTYALLWKHCTMQLQNSLRAMEDFEDIDASEDVVMLWKEIKRICTVGLMNNADPDKVQRDADFRFQGVHQRYNEPVSAFYDRYLQECEAWISAGNRFIEVEYLKEGEGPVNENDPSLVQAKAKVQEKAERKQAMIFLSKLDRARFTTLNDELSNDLSKGVNSYPNNIAEAMQLAQNYRTDGKAIEDLMVQGVHHEAGAYSTYGRASTGEKNYDRKRIKIQISNMGNVREIEHSRKTYG